jgi:hypothetical protein
MPRVAEVQYPSLTPPHPSERDKGVVEGRWKARSDVRSNGNVIGDHQEWQPKPSASMAQRWRTLG